MQKALIFGAGTNGAGNIARNASLNRYSLFFVDTDQRALDYVSQKAGYPVDVAYMDRLEEVIVKNVEGVYLLPKTPTIEAELAIARQIAASDVVLTAVGNNNLGMIAPYLKSGLECFLNRDKGAKNIILGENYPAAAQLVRGYLNDLFNEFGNEAEQRVGIVTSIIHVMGKPAHMSDTKHIVSEAFTEDDFVVDANAFRGNRPSLTMLAYSPFERMEKRKLSVHNLSHMAIGAPGVLRGIRYVWEAVMAQEINQLALDATNESCLALSKEYGKDDPQNFSEASLKQHRSRVYDRAKGKYLGDENKRLVDKVIERNKLSRGDRVIGAALLCLKHDIQPKAIAQVAAYTLRLPEFTAEIKNLGVNNVIIKYTGLNSRIETERELIAMIKTEYENLPNK